MYKVFIYQLRLIELKGAFLILLGENTSPKLCKYVRMLDEIAFIEGLYHTYYGDVKFVVGQLITYWTETLDYAVKQIYKYLNIGTQNDVVNLIEKTIIKHQIKQAEFGKEYLPVQSPEEQQAYEDIEQKYNALMESLFDVQASLDKLDCKAAVMKFLSTNFELSIKKTKDIFEFTYSYIGFVLVDHMHRIRVSLEEILLRLRNNLCKMKGEVQLIQSKRMQKLYDMNKHRLMLSRLEERSSEDLAEIDHRIIKITEEIKDDQIFTPITRLEEEVKFWTDRLSEFDGIENIIIKLQTEQKNVAQQERIYKIMKLLELPGAKYCCWMYMGQNFTKRKKFIKSKYREATNTLMTFFEVRGLNRIIYKDYIGNYAIDDYGHQIYISEQGSTLRHVNCDGTYREVKDADKYYFDKNGRYVIDKKYEKIYQCAACTSNYKLNDNDLLLKTTKDCGHSELMRTKCKMELKDPNNVAILPMIEAVNIANSLKPKIVKYLWESFGHILPEVLHDVGKAYGKNPIHYFGHRLITQKYNKTFKEALDNMKEMEAYRANILKERNDKAVAISKAWKSKQVKRRMPEESDNTQDCALYNANVAQQHLLNTLNYYYV